MTTYKITEVNKEQEWVKVEVTFEDGEVYTKRMNVDLTSEETVHAGIADWLSHYEPQRTPKGNTFDPNALVGRSFDGGVVAEV